MATGILSIITLKKITPEEVLNPFEDQKDFIFILPTHYT